MAERLFARSDIDSFINPGEKLSYDFWAGEHSICNDLAYIQFEYNREEGTCDITDLWSKKAGQGKRMIGEMARALGPGIKVLGGVINNETIDKLLEFNLVAENVIRGRREITISDARILRQLKIIKVLEGGGVATEKIVVRPPTLGEIEADLKLSVDYFGHT